MGRVEQILEGVDSAAELAIIRYAALACLARELSLATVVSASPKHPKQREG